MLFIIFGFVSRTPPVDCSRIHCGFGRTQENSGKGQRSPLFRSDQIIAEPTHGVLKKKSYNQGVNG